MSKKEGEKMTTLPNISFSLEEIEQIVSRSKIKGGEAYICTSGNPNSLYKIFYQDEMQDPISYNYNSEPISSTSKIVTMPYNKLHKLEKLYQMQLEHSVRPLSTISVNGKLVGYEMTKDPNDIVLMPHKMSDSELLRYLRQTKDILEYFSYHGILYGDVAPRNILINTKTRTAKFCDMDNIRLGSYDFDVKPYELISYQMDIGCIDKKADAYMHGLMTLTCLDIDLELCFIQRNYFAEHFEKEALDIIDGLGNPREFTGEYLIQYVKKIKG